LNIKEEKMAEFTERFRETKEKIRQAIISKGVEVPEGASLIELAAKIEEIKVAKISKKKEKA
jgi:hypothetical protein